MALFTLKLPHQLANQGWKVKIHGRERVETPHVTIHRKTQTWRWDIRDGGFMENEPDPRQVADRLINVIRANLDRIRKEWDDEYGKYNPV